MVLCWWWNSRNKVLGRVFYRNVFQYLFSNLHVSHILLGLPTYVVYQNDVSNIKVAIVECYSIMPIGYFIEFTWRHIQATIVNTAYLPLRSMRHRQWRTESYYYRIVFAHTACRYIIGAKGPSRQVSSRWTTHSSCLENTTRAKRLTGSLCHLSLAWIQPQGVFRYMITIPSLPKYIAYFFTDIYAETSKFYGAICFPIQVSKMNWRKSAGGSLRVMYFSMC